MCVFVYVYTLIIVPCVGDLLGAENRYLSDIEHGEGGNSLLIQKLSVCPMLIQKLSVCLMLIQDCLMLIQKLSVSLMLIQKLSV